jgi:O-antigen ligase
MRRILQIWLVAGLLLALPAAAWAGMPSLVPDESTRRLVLSEEGWIRYEAVSFFLMVLLLSGLVVRWLWNALAADFPKLPRLTYFRSLGVVTAWGLLFLVVLTLIAGARETMTPGVWQKQGLLYRIPGDRPAAQPPADAKGAEETKP